MCARDQDLQRLLRDRAPDPDACEDELDYAVVDRVYGVGQPSRRRPHERAHLVGDAERED